jgi:hypothetical protein
MKSHKIDIVFSIVIIGLIAFYLTLPDIDENKTKSNNDAVNLDTVVFWMNPDTINISTPAHTTHYDTTVVFVIDTVSPQLTDFYTTFRFNETNYLMARIDSLKETN